MKQNLSLLICSSFYLLTVSDSFLLSPLTLPYYGTLSLTGPKLSALIGMLGMKAAVLTGLLHKAADRMADAEAGHDPLKDMLKDFGFDIQDAAQDMALYRPKMDVRIKKRNEIGKGNLDYYYKDVGKVSPEMDMKNHKLEEAGGGTNYKYVDVAMAETKSDTIMNGTMDFPVLDIWNTTSSSTKMYEIKPQRHRNKRSVANQETKSGSVDHMLDVIHELDPYGCIHKTVCYLYTKEPENLSPVEGAITKLFSEEREEHMNPSNAPFFNAAAIGRNTSESVMCDDHFRDCPVPAEDLDDLIRRAWGCQL